MQRRARRRAMQPLLEILLRAVLVDHRDAKRPRQPIQPLRQPLCVGKCILIAVEDAVANREWRRLDVHRVQVDQIGRGLPQQLEVHRAGLGIGSGRLVLVNFVAAASGKVRLGSVFGS